MNQSFQLYILQPYSKNVFYLLVALFELFFIVDPAFAAYNFPQVNSRSTLTVSKAVVTDFDKCLSNIKKFIDSEQAYREKLELLENVNIILLLL